MPGPITFETPTALEYFASLVADDASLSLVEAAAAIAQDDFPQLDTQAVLAEIDALAARLKQRFPAEYVSPAIAYLSHESCAVSGALLNAGGGEVSARLVTATKGIDLPGLTIEDVRDGIDTIFDESAMTVVTDPRRPAESGGHSSVTPLMVPKAYQPG